MMKERKLVEAITMAEKIVSDEKLELPINIVELAHRHKIHVQPKPETMPGVSGMLIRVGENFAIAYATHIKNEGFQRFSIAHELGHYFLPSHAQNIFENDSQTIHESRAGFSSENQIELEADHFAAGLLMPKHLFIKEAGKYADGIATIIKLAERCNTSLTASAIRYADLSNAAVAVVVSSGSTVEFCFASDAMREIKGYRHLKKGALLPRKSLTQIFNQTSSNIQDADYTDTMLWFQTNQEVEGDEEVIRLRDYGKTLTIITATVIAEDDSEEERWKEPTFR